jgi:hypothetical protein
MVPGRCSGISNSKVSSKVGSKVSRNGSNCSNCSNGGKVVVVVVVVVVVEEVVSGSGWRSALMTIAALA